MKPIHQVGREESADSGKVSLSPRVWAVVDRVVNPADASIPADALLRFELRKTPLSRRESADAVRAVFSFYRWRGWLDLDRPLSACVRHALDLDQAFRSRPETFSDEKLLARALPSWIVERAMATPEWARSIQSEPELWVRCRKTATDTVLAGLDGCTRAVDLVPGWASEEALRYDGESDLFRTDLFHQGCFEVQDLSSQAVGLVCAPAAGETWWDACAGEGGKTLHLSDLMGGRGLIWATDRSPRRLEVLKRRAARAQCFNYRAAAWDGSAKLPTKTRFDGVLVDAPCSGVGTWQRNPHARWTLRALDVEELSAVQSNLLVNASEAVKPGGRLVYAVCTLTRDECEDVVARFEAARPIFEAEHISWLGAAERARTLRLSPPTFPGNGMFIAQWRRK